MASNSFKILDIFKGTDKQNVLIESDGTESEDCLNDKNSESSDSEVDSESATSNKDDPPKIIFEFASDRETFKKITEYTVYQRSRNHVKGSRQWFVFKQFKWQSVIRDKIWKETHYKCGIHFRKHYMTVNGVSGNIEGTYIY